MVETQLRRRGIRDARILAAFERVPRHLFVSFDKADQAYEDHPLVIGESQTISQPYIVASMLAKLDLQPQHSVLEIGTGSGYQTALLAELTAQVDSVERFASLAERARAILERLEYRNFVVTIGDGTVLRLGKEKYDRIVVSAAAPRVPEALVEQIKVGGRMIVPVGMKEQQVLKLILKDAGGTHEEISEGCAFVPLIGEQGFSP